MFKLHYKMSSNNARVENITLVTALHNHHTQAKNKNYFLSNRPTLTSLCSNGLLVNGPKVWNELPNNIKSEAWLFKFSKLVTQHFLSAYSSP